MLTKWADGAGAALMSECIACAKLLGSTIHKCSMSPLIDVLG